MPVPNQLPSQLRRLSNVHLTRQFHWRYMGLWVLLTMFLGLAFNVICYMLIEGDPTRIYTVNQSELEHYLTLRQAFLIGTVVEMVILFGGVIALAVFTAHRLAGPYIRLCAAFEAIGSGDYTYRLKFRRYDHLQNVEEAFNRMVERVQAGRDRPG